MTIKIVSTTRIVFLNGVPARVWEGQTESGVKVIVFVTRILVKADENQEQFQKELHECAPPSAEVEAIPLRMIL